MQSSCLYNVSEIYRILIEVKTYRLGQLFVVAKQALPLSHELVVIRSFLLARNRVPDDRPPQPRVIENDAAPLSGTSAHK